MVALFAFTLGVHLGKKVGGKAAHSEAGETHTAHTADDHTPGRVEMTENARGTEQTVDSALTETLHGEVGRTGIKLNTPRQVDLPKKTVSKTGGATTLPSGMHGAESELPALSRNAPKGEYTLQIGSYPKLVDAKDHIAALEALGVQPFVRAAAVKGERWYRIYYGGYPTVKEAERVGDRFKKQHVIETFIVAKMPSEMH